MCPLAALESAILNGFNFSGRASREEFWWFTSAVWAFYLLAIIFDVSYLIVYFTQLGEAGTIALFAGLSQGAPLPQELTLAYFWTPLVFVITFIPSQAVAARRLHDAGYSARYLALLWAPLCLMPIAILGNLRGYFFSDQAAVNAEQASNLPGFLSVVCLAAMLVLLLRPSDPNRNGWGNPPRSAMTPRGALGSPLHTPRTKSQTETADRIIFEGYATLARTGPQDLQAQKRAEIRALYRERVLGGLRAEN